MHSEPGEIINGAWEWEQVQSSTSNMVLSTKEEA
jgi:hypothetical protein